MIAHETSGWDILTAVGTVGAVVVALLLTLLPALSRWIRKPKLRIMTGDTEPHLTAVAPQGNLKLVEDVVVRLGVWNDGRTAAVGSWAKANRRWRRDLPTQDTGVPDGFPTLPTSDQWELVEEDPVHLRWSSLPFAIDRGAGVPPVVGVPPGHAEYAELAILSASNGRLRLAADDERTGRSRLQASDAIGTHRWEVVVGAEGVEPLVAVVEFVVDGKHFVRGVRLTDPPEGAVDLRLLGLLRGLAADS